MTDQKSNYHLVVDGIEYVYIGQQVVPEWLSFADNTLSRGCLKHLFVVNNADVALKGVVVAKHWECVRLQLCLHNL